VPYIDAAHPEKGAFNAPQPGIAEDWVQEYSPVAAPPRPRWPPVRTALLQDADYNAAVDAANQRAATRLEQYAMGSPDDWPMLAQLWNAMVGSIPAPNPLTPAVCDRLNTLFQGNHLPVTLNRDTALMNAP
jgi:hypothetical protein